jgi:flagellin-like hook-associated protein FlgL
LTTAQNVQVQWQTSLGQVRDADIAAVSTDMTAAETNQQAALAAEAHLPQTSLFDFLK